MNDNKQHKIWSLKRSNYWSLNELKGVEKLLHKKGDEILEVVNAIRNLKLIEKYEDIKPLDVRRVYLLKEQEALISLAVRIRQGIYENGKEILKLRDLIQQEKKANEHSNCT